MANLIPLGILSGGSGPYVWSVIDPGDSLVYRGGAYANLSNAQFFLFGASDTGGNTTSYAYSTDPAVSWTTGTMPASTAWGKAATNSTRLVVTRWSGSTLGAYTDNGTTWTSTTIWDSSVSARDIIWDGTRFLAVASDNTTNLSYSTNGSTWTTNDIGNALTAIAFDGTSRYIALADASTTTQRTCTSNPTSAGNWSNLTFPSTNSWRSIAFGNGIWLAIGYPDTVATSTNGTTWTITTNLPADLDIANSGSARVIFADGKFWFVNGSGLSTQPVTIYSTTDGTTWETEATIPANSGQADYRKPAAWGVGPRQIFVAGYDSQIDGADAVFVGVK